MTLVGERKAASAFILAFYTLYLLLASILPPDESLRLLFFALATTYGVAFFGLVAGYFWARWYAIGIGLFGLSVAAMAIFKEGLDYPQLFIGGTHGLVSLLLWSDKVAAQFDGRTDWRARFHMDDSATHRLGNAVIRTGVSLPMLIIYALAPRPDGMSELLALGSLALVGMGLWGLMQLRTWGILAMMAGGMGMLASVLATPCAALYGFAGLPVSIVGIGLAGAVLLLAATAPFARSILRYLRS